MPPPFEGDPGWQDRLRSSLSETFLKPRKPKTPAEEPVDLTALSPEERKLAIRNIDPLERKIGYAAAVLGLVITFIGLGPYINNPNKGVPFTAKEVGHSCPPGLAVKISGGVHNCTGLQFHSASYWNLQFGALLVVIGLVALATKLKRRSVVAFALLLTGFALESLLGTPIGLLFIFAGGWLVLRAYRLQKYGTTNAKEVAKIAATRPKRRERKAEASAPAKPTGYKAPKANKRYTPKAPARKKIAKPVE